MKKIFAITVAVALAATSFGQKLGHVNGAQLVEHMPEYKTAMLELDTLYAQWNQLIEEKKNEYQGLVARVQELQGKTDAASKLILQDKMAQLQALEQDIYQIQEQGSQDVNTKREEKIDPIQRKALKAVEDVGKENGYTYVFDISAGGVLYIGGEDVTPKVCAKLGIPDYSKEVAAGGTTPAPPKP